MNIQQAFSFNQSIGRLQYLAQQICVTIGAAGVSVFLANGDYVSSLLALILFVFVVWLNLSSVTNRLRNIGIEPALSTIVVFISVASLVYSWLSPVMLLIGLFLLLAREGLCKL